uniref:Uncharacterized protein n=1 Tax=Ciona intestinalis TaxID=7719 RepID=H2XUR2_CIOIN
MLKVRKLNKNHNIRIVGYTYTAEYFEYLALMCAHIVINSEIVNTAFKVKMNNINKFFSA